MYYSDQSWVILLSPIPIGLFLSNIDGGGCFPPPFTLRVEIGECDTFTYSKFSKFVKKIRPLSSMVRVQGRIFKKKVKKVKSVEILAF